LEAAISTGNPDIASTPGSSIHIRGLTKRFPSSSRAAVDAVDMDIQPGEFVVLLGPSGCGKTTLLKTINRISEPTSGRVEIDGVDILQYKPAELRRQIGYVIQQTGLFPHMTVAANVAVVPKLLGWDRQRTADRVAELLMLVGLNPDEYADRYPTQLSGGQQQRVGLARALAVRPPTMLMDEPFGALDAITRRRLQDELLRIHKAISQTVVFVTHDIDEAVRLADKIAVMREGKIEQFGTPLHIMQSPANAFVAELVGANDVLRRLSLVTAGDAMDATTQPADGMPRIDRSTWLRDALGIMAESGLPYLVVTDDVSGEPLGTLSFASIQLAAAPKPE
jgi:osmoprotectant transport system ATP-binding protein